MFDLLALALLFPPISHPFHPLTRARLLPLRAAAVYIEQSAAGEWSGSDTEEQKGQEMHRFLIHLPSE